MGPWVPGTGYQMKGTKCWVPSDGYRTLGSQTLGYQVWGTMVPGTRNEGSQGGEVEALNRTLVGGT